jgi:hypothetical protein
VPLTSSRPPHHRSEYVYTAAIAIDDTIGACVPTNGAWQIAHHRRQKINQEGSEKALISITFSKNYIQRTEDRLALHRLEQNLLQQLRNRRRGGVMYWECRMQVVKPEVLVDRICARGVFCVPGRSSAIQSQYNAHLVSCSIKKRTLHMLHKSLSYFSTRLSAHRFSAS